MSTNQTTDPKTTGLEKWLTVSSNVMKSIEAELQPTKHQLRTVGMEYAGTLSRLVKATDEPVKPRRN